MIGIVIKWLGILFLIVALIVLVDIIAYWRGFKMQLRSPISFALKRKDMQGDSDKEGIEAYAGRLELTKGRGHLRQELKGHKKVWVIWHEGRVALESGELEDCHIDRLILTDPEDIYMMKRYADRWNKLEEIDNKGVELKRREIEDTAKQIKKVTGAEIRYYSGPTSCTLILADTIKLADDGFSDNAWARMETGIPFHDTNNRPNIVLKKGQKPDQFEALRQHYIRMWANSRQSSL